MLLWVRDGHCYGEMRSQGRKIEKQRGLRTEPWGAPMSRVWGDEEEPAKETARAAREKTRRARVLDSMRRKKGAAMPCVHA